MSRSFIVRELRDILASFAAAEREYLRSPNLAYAIPAASLLACMVGVALFDDWKELLDKVFWKKLLLVHLPCFLIAWAWYISRSFTVRLCTACTLVAGEMILGYMLIEWWYRARGRSSPTLILAAIPFVVYPIAALVGFVAALQDRYFARQDRLKYPGLSESLRCSSSIAR